MGNKSLEKSYTLVCICSHIDEDDSNTQGVKYKNDKTK